MSRYQSAPHSDEAAAGFSSPGYGTSYSQPTLRDSGYSDEPNAPYGDGGYAKSYANGGGGGATDECKLVSAGSGSINADQTICPCLSTSLIPSSEPLPAPMAACVNLRPTACACDLLSFRRPSFAFRPQSPPFL